jgi:hypothetical protein
VTLYLIVTANSGRHFVTDVSADAEQAAALARAHGAHLVVELSGDELDTVLEWA